MYHAFFGVESDPFSMAADPKLLFLNERHREVLAGLYYSILAQRGLVVLTGDAGTGKTTLLSRACAYVPEPRLQRSVILHSTLDANDFLELTLADFGVAQIPQSKAQRLLCLQRAVIAGHDHGKISVLIIDEAHKLSLEVLEEIRLLGNLDRNGTKLLQIVLAGQNELNGMLERHDLRQFKQRIAVRLHLYPLCGAEMERYIDYRWKKSGGAQHPFSPAAMDGIVRWSRGIPRMINSICDNSLLIAFAQDCRSVTGEHVREACTDLHLLNSETSLQAVSASTPAADAPALANGSAAKPLLRQAGMPVLERYALAAESESWLKRWLRIGSQPRKAKVS
jgi:general secretion pathway protein A